MFFILCPLFVVVYKFFVVDTFCSVGGSMGGKVHPPGAHITQFFFFVFFATTIAAKFTYS